MTAFEMAERFASEAFRELGPVRFVRLKKQEQEHFGMRCSAWRWLNNPLAPLFSRTELASQLAEAMTSLKEQRQDLLANGVLTRFGNLAPWTVLHLGAALPDSALTILRTREGIDATSADLGWLREQRSKLIEVALKVLPSLRARLLNPAAPGDAGDAFKDVIRALPPRDLLRMVALEQEMRVLKAQSGEPRVITAGHWPFGGITLLLAVVAHVDAELTSAVTFDEVARGLPVELRVVPSYGELWRINRAGEVDAALDMWPKLVGLRRSALARSDALFEARLASIRVPDSVELPDIGDKNASWLLQQARPFFLRVADLLEAGVDVPDLVKLLPPPVGAVRRLEKRRDGWWGIDGAEPVYLGNGKGINRIAMLIRHPGQEFLSDQLDSPSPTAPLDPWALEADQLSLGSIDGFDKELGSVDKARLARLLELQKRIELADDTGANTAELKEEALGIAKALSATRKATGKTGRAKAAKAIFESIRGEEKRLERTFPPLAEAVRRIKTGQRLVFKPAAGERWEVSG